MKSATVLEAAARGRGQRIAASMGAVSAVLLLAGLFLPGAPAKTTDPVIALTEVLIDKRPAFTVGIYLAGLAVLALMIFLGALWDFLCRDRTDHAAAVTAVAGGGMGAMLILVGMSCSTGLAVRAAVLDGPVVVRALTDTGNVLIELGKLGLAALLGGVVAATGPPGQALSPMGRLTGAMSAAVLVVSALPPLLTDHGAWQMGGPGDIAGNGPAVLWLVWLSITMTRRAAHAAHPGRGRDPGRPHGATG